MTLITHLSQLRQRSGLSYSTLAARASDEQGHLHRVFSGHIRPRRDTLIRVAIALDLDVAETDELLRLAGFPGLLPASPAKT